MAGPSVYGLLPIAGAPNAIASYDLIHANSTTNRIECIDENSARVPFDATLEFTETEIDTTAGARAITAAEMGMLLIYNNAAGSTFTLPDSTTVRDGQFIALRCEGAGTLTVQGDSGDQINNAVTVAITEGNATLVVFDGANNEWYTVGSLAGSASGGGVSMPDQPESGSYTLVVGDAGQTVAYTGSTEATFTLPAASTFTDGDLINIVNNGTANLAIAPPSGTALFGYENNIQPVLKPGESCTIMSNGAIYRGLGPVPKRFAITLAMISALSGTDNRVPVRDIDNSSVCYASGVSNGTSAAGTSTLEARLGYNGVYEQLVGITDLQSTIDSASVKHVTIPSGNTIEARFTTSGGGLPTVTTMTRVEFELSGLI